ncbi:hypothetical protein OAT92_05365 [Porticoccaceae bacterium]|jgi:hypothetical protein|nr:hypothetical protein [Porticoccaceae bacterium]
MGNIIGFIIIGALVIVGLVNPPLLISIFIIIGIVMWVMYLFDKASLRRQEDKLLDMKRNPKKYEQEYIGEFSLDKSFTSKSPSFIKKIESQIESKDMDIIDTFLNRLDDFRSSEYFAHNEFYLTSFYNDLVKFGFTGKLESATSSILTLTHEESFGEACKKLDEKFKMTEFPKANEKQLSRLGKALKADFTLFSVSKGFPPSPRFLKDYAYPEQCHLLFGWHPNNSFNGELEKLTLFLDNYLDKEKVLLDLEKGRKTEIKRSLKKLDKARSKEKLSTSNAETFFTASELYLHDSDALERLKAKSLLKEFIETANQGKITPKMRDALEEASRRIKAI